MFRHNTLRFLMLVLVALVTSSALSACADSKPSSQVPTLEQSHASAAPAKAGDDEEAYLAKMRRFVQCVRKAGFPEMHDPTELGGLVRDDLLQLQGPKGKAIMGKCYSIIDGLPLPEKLEERRLAEQVANLTDEQKAANIAFSKCMQQNGVPEYPDAQPNGLGAIEPWSLPDATVARPPGLQDALDICAKILDPTDP